jgi:hypothetical protein
VKYDHPTPYFHNVSVHVCLNCSIYLNEPGPFGRSSRKLSLTWLLIVAAILIKARALISTWIKQTLGSLLLCTSMLGPRFACLFQYCSSIVKFYWNKLNTNAPYLI